MKKILTLIVITMLLISCSTPYQPNGLGGGYEDLKLSDDTYIVSFKGNGYTPPDKAFKYALRRCAHLTKDKGYQYFAILDSSTSIYRSEYKTPIQTHTNTFYTGSTYGNYTYLNGNSTTTYTGGDIHIIEKPYASITIRMYMDSQLNTFNADAILSNFQSKQPSVSQSTSLPSIETSTSSPESSQSASQTAKKQTDAMTQNDNTHVTQQTSEESNVEQ